MNSNVLRQLSYGVYVISTMDQGRPTGCIANSVMQITSSPVTVAVSMNHDNYTNKCIKESGVFSVSVLSTQCDPGLIGNFGFQSGKEVDKYESIPYQVKEGTPVVEAASGYMVFKVVGTLETTTHTVFLGEMVDAEVLSNEEPMTYAYYHKVVKGKSPKNAPTYLPEEEVTVESSNVEQYKCSICNYEYNGEIPFEELPEDYVCPICKQPKSAFQKIL